VKLILKSLAFGILFTALVACIIYAVSETYKVASHTVALAREGIWQPGALALCMIAGIFWAVRKAWKMEVDG